MFTKRPKRPSLSKDSSKRNGKLSEYMYLNDDKVAIDFWLQQPVINFKSSKSWDALVSHLKATRNKHITKEYLQNHWINKIDASLNELCGTGCFDREYLGYDNNLERDKKMEILGKRLEMVREARQAKLGSYLLAEEIEQPICEPEDNTVVVMPPKTYKNVVNSWCFRHEPRCGVVGIEDPKLILQMNQRRLKSKKPVATKINPTVDSVGSECTKQHCETINLSPETNISTCNINMPRSAESANSKNQPLIGAPKQGSEVNAVEKNAEKNNLQQGHKKPRNQTDAQEGNYHLIDFSPRLPLMYVSDLPGSESLDVRGFSLPVPCLAQYKFFVLKSPGNFTDYASALRHEYMIKVHSGILLTDISEVNDSTIVIASIDSTYNRNVFGKLMGNIYEPDIIYDWTSRRNIADLPDFHQYVYFPESSSQEDDLSSEETIYTNDHIHCTKLQKTQHVNVVVKEIRNEKSICSNANENNSKNVGAGNNSPPESCIVRLRTVSDTENTVDATNIIIQQENTKPFESLETDVTEHIPSTIELMEADNTSYQTVGNENLLPSVSETSQNSESLQSGTELPSLESTAKLKRPRIFSLMFELAPDLPMHIRTFAKLVEDKYRERYNLPLAKNSVRNYIRKMKSAEEEFQKIRQDFNLQNFMLDNLRLTVEAASQTPSITSTIKNSS